MIGKIMNKKLFGFTLIELLVVIAILGVLASIVMAVGSSVILKAQVKGTQGTILALVAACEQYRAVFEAYPALDFPGHCSSIAAGNPTYTSADIGGANTNIISKETPTGLSDTDTYSNNNYKEFNKRLRFFLEERIYEIDDVRSGPFVTQNLVKTIDSADTVKTNNSYMYVDAWGNYLRICPGRDHRLDTPRGPNNLSPDANKAVTLQAKNRKYYPLDIFSIGPDAENDVDKNGTQFLTKFDTTASGNDDLVSWFLDSKYSEKNYGSTK